ncbi:MAG: PAS domain S-box protein, partial [Planctomycetaceae bacterium]|nr:PAS domain S-box protein [Planctomycetaceae bacterium]
MVSFISRLFDTSGFMPRWYCGEWSPSLGYLHIVSDLGVWSAYLAIPLVLGYFLIRKRDLPFRMIFVLFGAFILACGTTHLMDAVIFWWPAYRLATLIKLATAAVSWATVLALVPITPLVLAMRTPQELEGEIAERRRAEDALKKLQAELEQRVEERTRELAQVNAALTAEIESRRRTEAALRQQREWFQVTLASIGDAVIVTDPLGHITFLNAGAETLLGWPALEAIGQPVDVVFQLVDEQTGERRESPVRAVLSRLETVNLSPDALLVQRDGKRVAIADSAAPIRTDGGEILGAVMVFHDISERKQSESVLRDNEERLRLALEAGHMGTWEWNLATDKVVWSPGLEAIHGLAPGTFAGTFEAYLQDVHPADRSFVTEALNRTLAEQTDHHIEYRLMWPDGSIHWVEGRGKLFASATGKPERMVGVCTDITHRKQAEVAFRFLADASSTLTALVEIESTMQKVARLSVPYFADWCLVDVVGEDGHISRIAAAHADPARQELLERFGRDFPSDWDKTTVVTRVLRSGQAELHSEISEEVLRSGAINQEHLDLIHALNPRSAIWVPLAIHGRILGAMGFVAGESGRRYGPTDLALAEDLAGRAAIALENSRLYREVRDADRRKDEFLAMLAHELRNPLAPIRNALYILRAADKDEETVTAARDIMERQVQHLIRLVDDLLDVSRIMRGRIELRREPIEIAAAVSRAIETAQPLIDEQQHVLEVSLPAEPIRVDADLIRLAQVIGNLLNNAAKYTERGGRIRLAVWGTPLELVISVKDTGIGISREVLPRIFRLFMQADRSIERSQGGLGIGLTVVQTLVAMHGGSITADSPGPGQGSEFIVRLPRLLERQSADDPATTAARLPAAGPASRRVLVVDDNIDAARTLAAMLRLHKHDVHVAHDGIAALEMIQANPPDVVLLDIGLPGVSGYEVARR